MSADVDRFISYSLPYKKEDFLEGVIYWSLNNRRTIKVNYSSTNGDHPPESIIKGNDQLNGTNYFHSLDENCTSWVEVEFENEWIIPCSIVIADSGNIYRLRNWNVEASQDGLNYDIIDSQTNYTKFQTMYQIEAFHIKRKSNKPYRIFRIQQTGPMSNSTMNLRLGRIEIFGMTAFCYDKCLNPPKFPPLISCVIRKYIITTFILFVIVVILQI